MDKLRLELFATMCIAGLWASACTGQTTNEIPRLASVGTNDFPFVEKHDLNAGDAHGYVTISADNPVIKAGERVSLEVRLVNTGMGRDFFNPYFKPLIGAPAQIALYDGNRRYLGNLLSWVSGSAASFSWDDFTFIPGGGTYIGFRMLVKPNYVMRPLPPGDYYLQFIYYKAFIALDPPWAYSDPDVNAKRQRINEFKAHFDCGELFRSNPVKITITK